MSYLVPIADVLNTARMFLNDANIQLWDDNTLMPMLRRAHEELQATLKQRAAPIMKTSVVDIVPVGVNVFPGQPDLLAPIQLLEAAPGGAGTLMTEADPLPLQAPTTRLNWWNWDGDVINFIGATTLREVLVYYWRALPLPTSGLDTLAIIQGQLWLSPRTAAIAAASVGEENTSQIAAQNAAQNLETVIVANRGRAPQNAGISIRP